MTLMKQSEFAALCGVSRAAVTNWRNGDELIMQGVLVDVEATHEKMLRHRKGGSPLTGVRVGDVLLQSTPSEKQAVPSSGRRDEAISVLPGETVEAAATRLIGDIGNIDMGMPFDEARRMKEVYLVLLNQLEYETKIGSLVNLDLARSVLFEETRAARDAWLNWPSKVGPMVAADLGIDAADKVTEVLTNYVHKQVSSLGEPDPQFVEPR